jgi:hypothetical protein
MQMNAIIQKILDHIDFFLSNPYESLILISVAIIISFIVLNHLYKERISTLNERVNLSDDRVEFYKSINAELEKKLTLKAEISPKLEISSQEPDKPKKRITPPNQTATQLSTNKVRTLILEAIADEESKGLATASMKIIQSIQPQHEIGDILSELVRMYHEQIVTWNNAPNFPEHWMELKLKNA